MSFRLRLTALVSLAVAVAIVGTSFVVYYTDRHELLSQVDADLTETQQLAPLNAVVGFRAKGKLVQQSVSPAQFQSAGGMSIVSGSGPLPALPRFFRVVLPRSATAVEVSVHRTKLTRVIGGKPTTAVFTTRTLKGVPTRTLTLSVPGGSISISRSLVDVDHNLSHLRWLLVFICAGGVGVAALLGALVAGRAVAPLAHLTETTERIVETGDLSKRTGRRGRDEISRLSTRLDELLAMLESSLRTQRQLVADASHELRTPIATLRANVGLLAEPGALDARERAELLGDVQGELEAMTDLVGELVELARGEEPGVARQEFRLDEVVQNAVDRAARRAPELSFRTQLEPSVVTGVPERVERAVANLLDNAGKWSPAKGTVDVSVRDGVVEVRDRGPGIADEDVPLVFNRFYRSARARGMPGAGLGLAIVKQVADAHGGSVTVGASPGGGAVLRLQLSTASA